MSAWTAADSAELDVLVFELARSHEEHRYRCEACRYRRCHEHGRKVCVTCKAGCPDVLAYLEHRATCWACCNSVKVETPTFGPPCPRYLAHIEHGDTCPACNPCPHLRTAIVVVVDWRDARQLRSRAEALRIERTSTFGANP